MSALPITDEPARGEIDAWTAPTLLEFGSASCGWCRAAQPLIATALAAAPAVRHVKIEDGRGRPLGRSFDVKWWPTLVAWRDGAEVARVVRPADQAAVAALVARLAAAAAPPPPTPAADDDAGSVAGEEDPGAALEEVPSAVPPAPAPTAPDPRR